MSVIMGKKHVMDLLNKNEVLSTYGASPIALSAALATLDVLEDEKISERSERLGNLLEKTIKELNPPHVKELRGIALFQSLVLDQTIPGVTPRRVQALAAHHGVLVGIGADRLRFSPPLTITEGDLVKALHVIAQCLEEVTRLGDFAGSEFLNQKAYNVHMRPYYSIGRQQLYIRNMLLKLAYLFAMNPCEMILLIDVIKLGMAS